MQSDEALIYAQAYAAWIGRRGDSDLAKTEAEEAVRHYRATIEKLDMERVMAPRKEFNMQRTLAPGSGGKG